jgi:hypothetical protein
MQDEQPHVAVMAEAVIEFAKEAIRAAIYINGGAAAGLLAFMPSAASSQFHLPTLAQSLLWFGWGVVSGAASFALSYLAQVYAFENHAVMRVNDRIFFWLRICAVGAWILSFVSFLGGLYVAYGSVS